MDAVELIALASSVSLLAGWRLYLVTLVTDACTTYAQERHDHALAEIRGYCRQVTTDELVAELQHPG